MALRQEGRGAGRHREKVALLLDVRRANALFMHSTVQALPLDRHELELELVCEAAPNAMLGGLRTSSALDASSGQLDEWEYS